MAVDSPNRNPSSSSSSSLFGRSRTDIDRALPDREDVTCPLCSAPPRRFATDFQGLSLSRCASCGLEFQSPRPTFAQLEREIYGDAYHPADHAKVDVARERHYRRQLGRLGEILGPSRRRLLDVGCGTGAFLGYASALGWHVDGSDVVITDWARQTGATLWEGQLPDIAFGPRRYDVIRFNHVLEHTPDPLKELRRARELMAGGGVLMVGVPNMAGLSIRLKSWQSRVGFKRQAWKHYGALHHLWFFTPRTLKQLVRMAGFDVLLSETPVLEKSGRSTWVTSILRGPMEATRTGGVLDVYARVR